MRNSIVIPFVSVLALGLLTGCEQEIPKDTVYDGYPPYRFQGDVNVHVRFVSNVEAECNRAGLEKIPDTEVRGCTVTQGASSYIIVRNPCLGSYSNYTKNLCHEIGHVNGWPGTHGK